ncbi:MAG TPA: hypothetical protein DDZ83_12175 [Nitrospinae bacterium]|nr:hypothetical protein [Nitrospinota bacterium]
MPLDMKGARKWARLLVCLAFHVILMGLGGTILIHVYGLARPEKLLFFPSFAAAAVIGVFCTWDIEGNRVAEAGNLAGVLTAVRLWSDVVYPTLDIGPWAYFGAWPVWGSYLANIAAILLAGLFTERRRAA